MLSDVLTGLGGANALHGLAGNDIPNGGGANDLLEGGVGADAMAGGTGNDTYAVDNATDLIFENIGGGTGSVRTALAAYSLAAAVNVENLIFTVPAPSLGRATGSPTSSLASSLTRLSQSFCPCRDW